MTPNSHFHTKEEIVIPTTTEDIAAPEIVHDTDMTFNPTQPQSDFNDPPPSTEDTAIDAWSGNFESYFFLSFVDIKSIEKFINMQTVALTDHNSKITFNLI